MVYGRLVKAPQRLELNICTEVEAYCMNNANKLKHIKVQLHLKMDEFRLAAFYQSAGL